MRVLGIAGSPRDGGNTRLLLDKALEGAKSEGAEVEKIVLNDLQFRPCQECGGCDETGECIVDDDMQMVYAKLREADFVILASPIFFGCLSAQTKMMIDRFQCCWVAKYVLKRSKGGQGRKRKGVFLCVGGQNRRDFFESAERIVKIAFATLSIAYSGALFYPGIDAKGAIAEHPTALDEAFAAGKSLVKVPEM